MLVRPLVVILGTHALAHPLKQIGRQKAVSKPGMMGGQD